MELFLLVLVLAVAGFAVWHFNKDRGFDANQDGKVDVKDVKPVVQQTVAEAKKVADVNKDGKISTADAKEAVKKAVKKAKAAKAKTEKKPKMTVAE